MEATEKGSGLQSCIDKRADYGDAEPHRGVYKGASEKTEAPDVEVQMIPRQ